MDDKRPTYEEAVKRLEEIVKKLESGAAPLDESIALFSEGAELVKTCTAILDEAEQKVKILTESEKSE
ncbi:MAG: exodeoxyribonuclease VII small subunit [Ruminococcus sp.]|jgi:exodeoxyribonuclease VII, small subunit|nr:exodeoxyribonuclease VII small subunit [Ruminococcus sp.]MDD6301154.1 exodeoxyribonuclease VII small subunit [Ruminococcus sp.]MDD7670075.1 exodeoxyribonuclease VII small subunit [Ruminococcus sp.]MDY2743808.1 exodeoxyribonuclease VII small subunit [Eubacteriales bacterium]CDD04349.1 exodeoxyribonuclease 7 small subunit [Ruminococcus sp. CAG:382]